MGYITTIGKANQLILYTARVVMAAILLPACSNLKWLNNFY